MKTKFTILGFMLLFSIFPCLAEITHQTGDVICSRTTVHGSDMSVSQQTSVLCQKNTIYVIGESSCTSTIRISVTAIAMYGGTCTKEVTETLVIQPASSGFLTYPISFTENLGTPASWAFQFVPVSMPNDASVSIESYYNTSQTN